jgi:sugar phosphate isomerase/epimerase
LKLSYSTLACPDWTLEQCVEGAKKYGYEGLELRLLDGGLLEPGLDKRARQRVKRVMDQAGLPVSCVDTSLCVAQPGQAGQREQIEQGRRFLEMAAEWKSPCIRVFSGPPEGADPAETMRGAAEVMEQLGRRGSELGVKVGLETHDAFCRGDQMGEIFGKVKSGFAGVLWDIQHPIRFGETPEQTAKHVSGRLFHLHVKDGKRPAAGDDWPPVLMGQGDVPIQECLEAAARLGFDGWVSLEWEKKWHPEIEDPEIALPQYAQGLHKIIQEL